MRTVLLLVCVLAGTCAASASGAEKIGSRLESLSWLLGHWERNDLPEGRSGYERWQVDGGGYAGVGVTLKNGKVQFQEKLRIEEDLEGAHYIADVPNNPAPVRFRLVEIGEGSVAFENPVHDFPKRIAYRLDGNRLEARVSGGDREMTFRFQRSANAGAAAAAAPEYAEGRD